MDKLLLVCALVLSFSSTIKAQDNFVSAGGNVSNSNGSEAFSIGLVVYTEIKGPGGSATQGIQYAYEIYQIGIKEQVIDQTLKVYPNPASEKLIITTTTPENKTYLLYNALGEVIAKNSLQGNNTNIDINSLEPGIYILQITSSNSTLTTYKIIKK